MDLTYLEDFLHLTNIFQSWNICGWRLVRSWVWFCIQASTLSCAKILSFYCFQVYNHLFYTFIHQFPGLNIFFIYFHSFDSSFPIIFLLSFISFQVFNHNFYTLFISFQVFNHFYTFIHYFPGLQSSFLYFHSLVSRFSVIIVFTFIHSFPGFQSFLYFHSLVSRFLILFIF